MSRNARNRSSLITRSLTAGAKVYKRSLRESSFAESADLTDKFGASDLTLSRSAGSVYYFNGSGVLVPTGDNVAAFTSNGLFIEGEATNLIAAANYRDISTWTATGASMKATTPTLIDGTTGTSAKNEILEDTGTTEHRYAIAWTAASAAKQSAMVAVKRGTGTRHAQLRIGNATDGVYGSVAVNLDTLAVIGSATAEYWTAYVKGAYTIIELVDSNTTTGTQTLYVNLHNGTSNSYTGDGTSTLVIDWAQVVTSGVPQSHIQGAATRYSSFFSRPWIGATTNFWVYVDFYLGFSSAVMGSAFFHIFSVRYDTSNVVRARLFISGGDLLRITSVNLGSAQFTDGSSFSIDRGDRVRLLVTFDRDNGLRFRATNQSTLFSGTIGTSKAPIAALASGTTFYFGNEDGSTAAFVNRGEYRGYKIGTGILTAAQMAEIVGA